MKSEPKHKHSKGAVLILAALTITILIGVAGFSIDLGYTYHQKLLLQRAADQAALAAVLEVQSANADANVQTMANNLLIANAIDINTEKHSVTCGRYNPLTHTFFSCKQNCPSQFSESCPCRSCSDSNSNTGNATAVEVQLKKQVPTFMARVFGINSMTPAVKSVAFGRTNNAPNCIRPFGMEAGVFTSGTGNGNQVVMAPGTSFTVGRNSAGNWGKLDMGINGSSGTQFEEAMLNGVCSYKAAPNSMVSPGTGAAEIKDIFDTLAANGDDKNLVFAVVSPFGNGNRDVQILNYAKVNYISDNNRNGSQWMGTFELVEYPTIPSRADGTGAPIKAYLGYLK